MLSYAMSRRSYNSIRLDVYFSNRDEYFSNRVFKFRVHERLRVYLQRMLEVPLIRSMLE